MTITQHLKAAIIEHLGDNTPDETIAVVDSKQRAEIAFPTLTVSAPATSAFNESLPMVEKIEVEITLRIHSGDTDEASIDSWADQIESLLNDVSIIGNAASKNGIKIYDWTYGGSSQEWADSVIETTFTAECICGRI